MHMYLLIMLANETKWLSPTDYNALYKFDIYVQDVRWWCD